MTSLLSKLFLVGIAAAAVAIPPLQSRVTDLTATLDASQKDALERTLAAFERRKGAQIAVLIVPSTQPETVEQYAVRVEEQWKLGRKGIDDGVLLLVAKDDRRLRIEVGYGLEGVLPDAAAKRIVEDDITPRFRQGDFYGGIRAGLDRVMRTIDGEPLPPPARRAPAARQNDISEWMFPLFFIFLIGGGILKAVFGRFAGGGIIGGVIGFIAWTIAGSIFVAVLAGLLAFVFAVLSGAPGSAGGGGWSSGGSWGGGFGGSGGGFSGGGGSSGGGGASGSW